MDMRCIFLFCCLLCSCIWATAQTEKNSRAEHWADSVLNSLAPEQRIAQLMVVRLSGYDFKTKTALYFDSAVEAQIKKYNPGALCIFQGDPVKLAEIVNRLQSVAQTPLMVCMDAEWGVGMRLIDSVDPLPKQMMLGAMQDKNIVYQYGRLVAAQCRRLGVNVNYAPVVDINNNPGNPVINDRSFGEDKYKVATFGIEYIKGLQDAGVMACAKHFPGHGDVSVDSHLDLPVINKSIRELDSLELYPFRQVFAAGVGSAMIAHLYIPAIDNRQNRATSLSKNSVTDLLRNTLGYRGLTFTDALEMQGVKKFFPEGEASVESLIAGNDMLCLPGDIDQSIQKIQAAIADGRLTTADIDQHCKKVLLAKFAYGADNVSPVNPANITADLNKGIPEMRRLVAENAITLLNRSEEAFFPLTDSGANDIAYVGIGINSDNDFAKRMKADLHASVFYFDYRQPASAIPVLLNNIKNKYKKVVIGIHNYNRAPANNFGISSAALALVKQLQEQTSSVTFAFGNAYAIKNFCTAKNLFACYEDDGIVQNTAADILMGKVNAIGRLPVTVCDLYHFGSGLNTGFFLPATKPTQ